MTGKLTSGKSFAVGITKLEIARIHLDSAIQMFFTNYNPVSLNLVASVAFQILRDLAKHENKNILNELTDFLEEKNRAEFWRIVNKPSLFFKHADRDPKARYRGNGLEINDLIILYSTIIYRKFSNDISQEIDLFETWCKIYHAHLLSEESRQDLDTIPKIRKLRKINREESLDTFGTFLQKKT